MSPVSASPRSPGAPTLLPSIWPSILLALLAGGSNVFAFAPFGWWPLQLACTALLFGMVLRAPTIGRAALLGWLYSFAWCAAGVHWLYVSLHDLGGMPAWLTVLAIGLLALGLGLLVGAATGGARWLQARLQLRAATMLLLTLPALWCLAEWTRSWIFTGFPWLASGYAHSDSPLAGFAPVLGVYGIGWIAALMAAALVLLAARLLPSILPSTAASSLSSTDRSASAAPATGWTGRGALLLPLALLVILPLAGQLLRGIDWTHAHGTPIDVRLLQGNIAQEMKFDAATLDSTLALYRTLITAAPADLIATPETALPVTRQQLPPDYLQHLADFAGTSGSRLLIGIPLSDSPEVYTNSAILIDPQPAGAGGLPVPIAAQPVPYRYDKHHLVPFGEFIPPGFRWFVDFMHIPLGDQTRGKPMQPPFPVRDQWVLPDICYEDLFGEEIAAQIRTSVILRQPVPTILLNLSNIAWFGDTIAVPQHLQISRMRSLETRRPMLRATNTGATAVIDARGRVQAELAPFTRGALAARVQGRAGLTPYVAYGNAGIVWLAMLALLMPVFVGWRESRRRSHRPAETR